MAQSIQFTDPETGNAYTLEFNRDSVRFAEDLGVNLVDVSQRRVKPATLWSQLFYAALHMHHPMLTQQQSDDMWSRVPNKADVFNVLLEMYGQPYAELLGDKAEGDPKNSIVIQLPKTQDHKAPTKTSSKKVVD